MNISFLKEDEIENLTLLEKKCIIFNAMQIIDSLADEKDFIYKKEKDIWSYNNIDLDKIWEYLESKENKI